jgi:hypothetical protein
MGRWAGGKEEKMEIQLKGRVLIDTETSADDIAASVY